MSSTEQTAKKNTSDGNEKVHRHSKSQEQDLDVFVNDLLNQMTSRFENMGTSIITRIDDMGERIDSLEQNITDLLDNQGVERFDNANHSHSHPRLHPHSQSKHKTKRVERFDSDNNSSSKSKHKSKRHVHHLNQDK